MIGWPRVDESLRTLAAMAREEIQRGSLRGARLAARLASIAARERDLWIDAVLAIDPPPPDVADLPRGAVPYLPCAVDEIVAAVIEAPLVAGDVLVDIGAGLGRVVLLAHLLSAARARGIEIQAPLVERATACRAALGLVEDDASFVHANAVDAPLDGNVFFLYAPCNGAMMRSVLARLEREARDRRIVLAAVGLELRDAAWPTPRATPHASLTIYESLS